MYIVTQVKSLQEKNSEIGKNFLLAKIFALWYIYILLTIIIINTHVYTYYIHILYMYS